MPDVDLGRISLEDLESTINFINSYVCIGALRLTPNTPYITHGDNPKSKTCTVGGSGAFALAIATT